MYLQIHYNVLQTFSQNSYVFFKPKSPFSIKPSSNSPICLTRDRYVNESTGSLRDGGNNGYSWEVIAYSSELYAYNIHLPPTSISPSGVNARWHGFTVRKYARPYFSAPNHKANPANVVVGCENVSGIKIKAIRRECGHIGASSPKNPHMSKISRRTRHHVNVPATS